MIMGALMKKNKATCQARIEFYVDEIVKYYIHSHVYI